MARKEIDYRKMSEKEKRQLVAEVNILRELRHPNIVRYYERMVDKENRLIYIMMEYCEGGDLASIIKRCKRENKRIPEDIIWGLFTQLLEALFACHNGDVTKRQEHPTILHRDIKPDNVFLDGDQNVKLGDFGLSRVVEDPEMFARTFVGTPFYMSPELINETSYNAKSDIWALGCLIYELCTLEPPFNAKTQAELAAKIQQGKVPPLPPIYSSELNRTIRAMLNVNYMKRPSAGDFLKMDRIRLYKRERELNNYHTDMKRREEDLARREMELAAREAALAAQQANLNAQTEEFRRAVASREEEMQAKWVAKEEEMQAKWVAKEEELKQKEVQLAEKERSLENMQKVTMSFNKPDPFSERQPLKENRNGYHRTTQTPIPPAPPPKHARKPHRRPPLPQPAQPRKLPPQQQRPQPLRVTPAAAASTITTTTAPHQPVLFGSSDS
ncbi:G2-specific serine/threonine protein kinase [Rhizophlyctis rosea]|nr:G2-specific serine/threonine protein kinase [Rhizophlyctis rosea]